MSVVWGTAHFMKTTLHFNIHIHSQLCEQGRRLGLLKISNMLVQALVSAVPYMYNMKSSHYIDWITTTTLENSLTLENSSVCDFRKDGPEKYFGDISKQMT